MNKPKKKPMLKKPLRAIDYLSIAETTQVRENLNWFYFSKLFSGAFLKQIKKGTMNAKACVAHATIIRETSPNVPLLKKYTSATTLGRSIHDMIHPVDEQSKVTEHKCYQTELYKIIGERIKQCENSVDTVTVFDEMLGDVSVIEQIETELKPYVEEVRQVTMSDTPMFETLVGTRDRSILISYILAFKSLVLSDGYVSQ